MKKKSKVLCMVLGIVAALLLTAGYLLYVSFNGSVIVKVLLTGKVERYVAEQYPELPLKVQKAGYDFKVMGYYCYVYSPESQDTSFTVWKNGRELEDDYSHRVLEKENTVIRLMQEADTYTEQVIGEMLPYRTALVLCDNGNSSQEEKRDYITLDQPFDPTDYPFDCNLTIWVETQREHPDWQELAGMLREVKQIAAGHLPFVKTYSITILEKFVEVDGEYRSDNLASEVCVAEVPGEIIKGEELEAYLEGERAAAEAEKQAIAAGVYEKEKLQEIRSAAADN
ncbi:MAG: hypothetical protein Q4B85_02885 [Lachnospiraceae bacterium]|nr:hypothetical protein [Lachnospiraceae bacterium]